MSRFAVPLDRVHSGPSRGGPAGEGSVVRADGSQEATALVDDAAAKDRRSEGALAAGFLEGCGFKADPELRFGAAMTLSSLLAVCAAVLLAQQGSIGRSRAWFAAVACVVAVVGVQFVARLRALRALTRRGESAGLPSARARQYARETLRSWLR